MKIRTLAAAIAAATILVSGCATDAAEDAATTDQTTTAESASTTEASSEDDGGFASRNLEAAITLGSAAVTNLEGNEKMDPAAYEAMKDALATAEAVDESASSEEKMDAATALRDAIAATNQSILDHDLEALTPVITQAEEALAAAQGASEEAVAVLSEEIQTAKELVEAGGTSEASIAQQIQRLQDAIAELG